MLQKRAESEIQRREQSRMVKIRNNWHDDETPEIVKLRRGNNRLPADDATLHLLDRRIIPGFSTTVSTDWEGNPGALKKPCLQPFLPPLPAFPAAFTHQLGHGAISDDTCNAQNIGSLRILERF